MRLLIILFCIAFIWIIFNGEITYNNKDANVIQRIVFSIISSTVISLVIGLPILGLISLL